MFFFFPISKSRRCFEWVSKSCFLVFLCVSDSRIFDFWQTVLNKTITKLLIWLKTYESQPGSDFVKTSRASASLGFYHSPLLVLHCRLRKVSLFLENPWERTQNKKTCKRDCERDLRAAMPRAASSVGVGRRVKEGLSCKSGNAMQMTCYSIELKLSLLTHKQTTELIQTDLSRLRSRGFHFSSGLHVRHYRCAIWIDSAHERGTLISITSMLLQK